MSEDAKKAIGDFYIDPKIFTTNFVKCCDVKICSGECCYYGVYTDKYEADLILDNKERVVQAMDETQTKDTSKWFEEPEEDEDFDSGIAVGTDIHNGKCVFLDKLGYCTLQKIACEDGLDKWKYKPLYCILFPLVIYDDTITIDFEHLDRLHFCNKSQNQDSTIFDCCQEELKYLLGANGMAELYTYRDEFLSNKSGDKL